MNKTNTKGFMWAWLDDDGVHVNQAETLGAIINDVIDVYISGSNCNVKQNNDDLIIEFSSDCREIVDNIDLPFNKNKNNTISFKVKANGIDVARFLERVVAKCDNRADRFDIKEIN